MKKIAVTLTALFLSLALFSCGGEGGRKSGTVNTSKTVEDVLNEASSGSNESSETKSGTAADKKTPEADDGVYDVDLTKLTSTLVYSQVYAMVSKPEDYLGKKVKMNGTFSVYETPERNYYACLIKDATACCAQGIEFVLANGRKYPEEYPAPDDEITVIGVFDMYYEGEYTYFQLIDAVLQ